MPQSDHSDGWINRRNSPVPGLQVTGHCLNFFPYQARIKNNCDLDMPWRLSEVPFEGVTVIGGCFHAVYLANYHLGSESELVSFLNDL